MNKLYRIFLILFLWSTSAIAQTCPGTPTACPSPTYNAATIGPGMLTATGGGTLGGSFAGAPTLTGSWNFSGGLVGTLTGGASLDLPLAGGTLTGALHMGANTIDGSAVAFTGGALNGVTITGGNASAATVTGNSITNPLSTWTSYLAGAANPNPLVMAQAGVFTNTQMNAPYTAMLNGTTAVTEFQYSHPGNFSTQAFAAGVTIPSGSTVYDSAGIAAYVNNNSTTTSGTGGEFYVRNSVAGATAFALNPLVTDQNPSGSGGFASTMVGAEFDIGAFNTASTAYGINMIGVFPHGTPVTAVGYQLSVLNSPWGYGFLTGDGAASNAALIGSVANAANSDGQPFVFNTHDGSNVVRQCLAQAQHTTTGFANFVISCPGGGGVILPESLLVSGRIDPSTTNGIGGTSVGDNANPGSIGEFQTFAAAGTSLTTVTPANATSISLSAGDWDVWGGCLFVPAGSTVIGSVTCGINTTSGAIGGTGTYQGISSAFNTGSNQAISAPSTRVNVSAPTTVYLVSEAGFTVSTMTVNGTIFARRRR